MIATQTPVFHKSCSTISVYNFYKATLFNDFRYLIKEYDEDMGGMKSYKHDKELGNILKDIIKDYAALIRDKNTMKLKKMEYAINFLVGKYNLIGKVLNIYKDSQVVEVLDILNDLDIPFDLDKPIGVQLDKAIQVSKGIKNQINIKRIALKKLSGDDKDEDEKQSPEDIIRGLDKTALLLEGNLDLKYRVDVKGTNLERWVNLLLMNKEKASNN